MSGKRASDYGAALKAVLDESTDDQQNNVERVFGDFEAAVWKAVHEVLPHVDAWLQLPLQPVCVATHPGMSK